MLDILYHDEWLVAVHKPSGLLVHRTAIDPREGRFAMQMVRDQIGQRVYPVHRLDKGTSGVLLFALDRPSAASLCGAFEHRDVGKRYMAIVRGHPPEEGRIELDLKRPSRRQSADDEQGSTDEMQSARTSYRRLGTTTLPYQIDNYPTSRYALMELCPETGRQHQLRRHLKHIAHPIIGDGTHGAGRHNQLFDRLFGYRRLMLACTLLDVPHPEDGRRLTIRCPLADDFMQVVEQLPWNEDMSVVRSDLPEGFRQDALALQTPSFS
jgi:tRNA pseudouridine65 synthase